MALYFVAISPFAASYFSCWFSSESASEPQKQTFAGAVWRPRRHSAMLLLLLLLGIASHVKLGDALAVSHVEDTPVLADALTAADVENDLTMHPFDSDIGAHEVMAQEMVLVQEDAPPAPQDIFDDVVPSAPVYKSFKEVDRTASIPERIHPLFEDFERCLQTNPAAGLALPTHTLIDLSARLPASKQASTHARKQDARMR